MKSIHYLSKHSAGLATKSLFFGVLALFSTLTFGQNVGINGSGTSPRNCAMLDIVSSNSGVLIPNLSLTATGTYAPAIGTAVDGLLVYNTNAGVTGTGAQKTGYYYWSTSASRWIALLDFLSPSIPWFLLGNTGITNPAVPGTYGTSTIAATEDWLGTTDSRDIVFGTNQIERMRIMQTSGRIGIGTASPNSLTEIVGSSSSRISTTTNNGSGDVMRAYSTGGTISAGYAGLFSDVSPAGAGSDYVITAANAATQSQMSSPGTLPSYSFGVLGNVFTTSGSPTRNGGVIGTGIYGNQWTSLGYVSSFGTIASLYYNNNNSSVGGTGRVNAAGVGAGAETKLFGVGIAGNSDLIGYVNNGGKAGMFVSGEKFGTYTDGTVYSNNITVQVNKSNAKNVPTFASTSTSVDIQTRGHLNLVNGHARVEFNDNFMGIVSEDVSTLNITLTPVGNSNGLYIANISKTGFDVYENNKGVSNVAFNWLAIGIKKGFETPVLCTDVLKTDFESNMKDVANNEGDPSKQGKPIWWDGTSFRFDKMPDHPRPFAAGKKVDDEPKPATKGHK
jgi:hypothetical protein